MAKRSEEKELKSALLKKRIVKSNVTKLNEKVISIIGDADLAQLQLFKDKIKIIEDVSNIFQIIFEFCEEEQIETYIEERQIIDDTIDEICLMLNRKMTSHSVSVSKVSDAKPQASAELKLPKLTLPTFGGQIEDWMTFCDLFTASIHNNASLSDAQKLQYLKSSCKADALAIIQSIPITDSNYAIAWELLVERFSNNRELVNALIKKLINQPCISDTTRDILHLVDVLNECKRSLEALNQKIEGFSEVLIVYVVVEKLHRNTRSWWERSLKKDELSTIGELTSFLKDYARTIQVPPRQQRFNARTSLLAESQISCTYCNGNHSLLKCSEFSILPVKKRFDFVKQKKLCFNCLSSLHVISNCKSTNKCKKCNKYHHSLLHFDRDKDFSFNSRPVLPSQNKANSSCLSPKARVFTPVKKPEGQITETNHEGKQFESSVGGTVTNFSCSRDKQVLLSTAIVYVRDSDGNFIQLRALLDSGSQSSFITRECADWLKTKRKKSDASVAGLNGAVINIKETTTASIANAEGDFIQTLQFFIVPKITRVTPARYLHIPYSNQLQGIKLADPEFYKPGPIHILLSNEVFFDLLKANKIHTQGLILQETVFGYVASGSVCSSQGNKHEAYCGFVQCQDDLSNTLNKFWELEGIETKSVKGQEEQFCEEHFLLTHSRMDDGRYVVEMPIKKDCLPSLGDSHPEAQKRLNSLWKRLSRNPTMQSLYADFIHEYEALGHMEEVFEEENKNVRYYLPHHGVYRPDKPSTKLRVVYDASAATTSGVSLNDLLLNGGTVQDDLFAIISRFRTHKYAFTADITKMYRQILITEDQRDLQRILWKDGVDGAVKTYRLRTITYGTANAPYLATRTLNQLAADEEHSFPLAAAVTRSDFYVDDVLTGANTLTEARELQSQLVQLLARGGVQMHRWCANHSELLNDVVTGEEYAIRESKEDYTVKTLGLHWKPEMDCFTYKLSVKELPNYTKRTVLSDIARIFYPLGLLGPAVSKAKIFMQRLWLLKLDWNDHLPEKIAEEWRKFVSTMQFVNCLKIDRCVLSEHSTEIQIHGFADASEHAYGAAIYIRCLTNSQPISNLLCSKSRVAPLKSVTIPRLELCAALLLSQLISKVVHSLKVAVSKIHLWSDSTIVLSWIHSSPHLLKTFVANRVAKIQDLTHNYQWHHVRSEDNPADLVSRGMNFDKIRDCDLWWHGPPFLTEEVNLNDKNVDFKHHEQTEDYSRELKKLNETALMSLDSNDLIDYILTCSNNYSKIVRVLSYLFRFVNNLKNPLNKTTGFITTEELKRAQIYLVREEQKRYFTSEFSLLSQGKEISKKSKLRSLHPFVDAENVIRLGGRLHNSSLNFSKKHPIILPAEGRLSKLIMEHFHKKYLHLGPQALLCSVRQEFWPLHGRNIARRITAECIICCKNKPVALEQIMGSLPAERVKPSFPFNVVGVDFCGPFTVKNRGQRKGNFHKIYLAIFICFITRAMHIELVSDLTSEAFIFTLKRFVARRGKCTTIFSDNAKNFVGAAAEIRGLHEMVRRPDEKLSNYFSDEGITWKFIPPRAPNFGGLWEAGVKSVKYHLRRTIGNSKLTYEELLTVIAQIEAILNSRPITPLSSDVSDLEALTPGHFLIGRPMTAIVEPELVDANENRLSRWQRTTRFVQLIWKRWHNDYLNTLQQRSKWQFQKKNIEIGTLVLIKEDNLPTNKWLLGRIVEIIEGSDGKVRVVEVRTANGTLKRSVSKICVLPLKTSPM